MTKGFATSTTVSGGYAGAGSLGYGRLPIPPQSHSHSEAIHALRCKPKEDCRSLGMLSDDAMTAAHTHCGPPCPHFPLLGFLYKLPPSPTSKVFFWGNPTGEQKENPLHPFPQCSLWTHPVRRPFSTRVRSISFAPTLSASPRRRSPRRQAPPCAAYRGPCPRPSASSRTHQHICPHLSPQNERMILIT